MAGKLKTQEVILQSPNGLVEKTVTVGNDGIVTIDNINVSSPTLFKEYTVPSNTTSFTIDGLDINTHKSYRLEIELINPTSTDTSMFIGFNGNVTSSNYDLQFLRAYSTTVGGNRANSGEFAYIWKNTNTTIRGSIALVNGKGSYLGTSHTQQSTTDNMLSHYGVYGRTTLTNITSLTIYQDAYYASSAIIGVGSKIRIYRGDL